MVFYRNTLGLIILLFFIPSIALGQILNILEKNGLNEKTFNIDHDSFIGHVTNNIPKKYRNLIKIDNVSIKYSNPRLKVSGITKLEVVDIDVFITAKVGDLEQAMVNESLPFVNGIKTGKRDKAGVIKLGKKTIDKSRVRFSIRAYGKDYRDKWPRTRRGRWRDDIWLDLSILLQEDRNDIRLKFNTGHSGIKVRSGLLGLLFKKTIKREVKKMNKNINSNLKYLEKTLDDRSINFEKIGFFSHSKWTSGVVKKFKWTEKSNISSKGGSFVITAHRNTPRGISAKTAKWIDSNLTDFLSPFSK